MKNAFFCCYLPAKPIEEDLQSSVEAETEVGAAALSDPKDVTEGDGATEPVEAQPRGETSPAPAPGTSGTLTPSSSDFARPQLCEV